jgi:uncharacterized protein YhbP (UPF0306 family)
MNNVLPLPDEMYSIVRAFLAGHSTLVLATAGMEDGRPQAAALFFASDAALNLYWISSPDSRHSINLADWDDVAAVVFEPTWEWAQLRGVQIEGRAQVVADNDERGYALALYEAKFAFASEEFEELIEQSTIYVLRPRWLRWLDNGQGFGYRQEFLLEPPR